MATLELHQEGDRALLRVQGELDQDSVRAFEVELRRAIRASAEGVMLDVGGVTFIDSVGLRVLISAAMMAQASRRQFSVLHASEQVRSVIETCGVEDLLPLAD